jgi:hypothetical protein
LDALPASGQVGKWVGALIKAQRAYHVQSACHGTGSRYHVTIGTCMHKGKFRDLSNGECRHGLVLMTIQ